MKATEACKGCGLKPKWHTLNCPVYLQWVHRYSKEKK